MWIIVIFFFVISPFCTIVPQHNEFITCGCIQYGSCSTMPRYCAVANCRSGHKPTIWDRENNKLTPRFSVFRFPGNNARENGLKPLDGTWKTWTGSTVAYAKSISVLMIFVRVLTDAARIGNGDFWRKMLCRLWNSQQAAQHLVRRNLQTHRHDDSDRNKRPKTGHRHSSLTTRYRTLLISVRN